MILNSTLANARSFELVSFWLSNLIGKHDTYSSVRGRFTFELPNDFLQFYKIKWEISFSCKPAMNLFWLSLTDQDSSEVQTTRKLISSVKFGLLSFPHYFDASKQKVRKSFLEKKKNEAENELERSCSNKIYIFRKRTVNWTL